MLVTCSSLFVNRYLLERQAVGAAKPAVGHSYPIGHVIQRLSPGESDCKCLLLRLIIMLLL